MNLNLSSLKIVINGSIKNAWSSVGENSTIDVWSLVNILTWTNVANAVYDSVNRLVYQAIKEEINEAM